MEMGVTDEHGQTKGAPMPLGEYLKPSRTLVLQATAKMAALEELAAALCRDDADLDYDTVMQAIMEREQSVSSRIAPHIALPHAVLPGYGRQILAVGYSPTGIPWNAPNETPVILVVMSLCGETRADDHIRMLAELARSLRDPAMLARMSAASSVEQIYAILQEPAEATSAIAVDRRKLRVCRSLALHACAVAKETRATALMLLADDVPELEFLDALPSGVQLIQVTGGGKTSGEPKRGTVLAVPLLGLRRAHRVKLAFLFALSRGLIDKGDTVVCLSGDPSAGTLQAMEIINVAEEFHILLSLRAQLKTSDIGGHVLDRILHIAAALAREGREGSPVGAIFVLGDYDNIRRRCQQLVMNPFRGYPENERNILDPSLEETIKEFSRIDGAFLIRGDGVIMSAGSHIQTENASESLESGLGARHAAALAITVATRALSIVISESTRRISLFKQGRLVMALDQALH
jgi:DNA integrity scanning protein DisA with diadenylate cyclase activity/mannitol/fructose-specific phosphotransferase system IIA component (Ntr-type)